MWLVWSSDNSNWLALKGPMIGSFAQVCCSQVQGRVALTVDEVTSTVHVVWCKHERARRAVLLSCEFAVAMVSCISGGAYECHEELSDLQQ